ncbi:MAG: ABC transporter ATP-binding protein [Clostridiales bacterium]|nr:ABC transporter ATP-binding protein [Clostridiales bacterium]
MEKPSYASSEYAVEMNHVSKIYKLQKKDGEKKGGESFYALKDISLKIKRGDVVGILGTNGSGKSTLSMILAGISDIDEGELTVHGEQELISINTGLNSQLTGLENIYLKGALLGFNKKKTKEIVDGVVEFAELGDFLYQPVKKYSSGMKSRLGFSISLALTPDIFIIDEALSVGDKGFAKKCLNRMMKLRDENDKTILFISHSLPQVKEFCKTGLWIEGGRLMETGPIKQVCDHYSDYVEKQGALSDKEKKKILDEKFKERLIVTQKKSLVKRILL